MPVRSRPDRSGVAVDDLVPGEEAGTIRHRRERVPLLRRRRRRPIGEHDADIDERIAERTHLPVEHRDNAADILGVDHDVIELEIAVHDRRRRRIGRQAIAQPLGQRIHLRQRRRLRSMPAFGPAADLTLDEAGWLAERAQGRRSNVDRVQIGQRVDHRGAEASARGRVCQRRRLLGADDESAAALHRVEHRADDVEILAEQVGSRGEREDVVHRRQPPEFARHVVRGGRDRAERRTPDHDLDVAESHEIGQVRMAAGKLRHLGIAAHIQASHAARRQTVAQPGDEARPIELLAGPDVPGIRFHGEKAIMRAMRFDHTDKVTDLVRRLDAFMREHVYPNEHTYHRQIADGDRWAADRDRRRAQADRASRGSLEPLPARKRVRRRADQRRVRAALRNHGSRARIRTRKCSTVRRPTPATWKCSSATAARRSAGNGSSRFWPARSARALR